MSDLPSSALVLGLARSGKAATAALTRRGIEVRGVERELGNDRDLGLLDGVDLLVKSPGVRGDHPLVVDARARGIRVWSEIELGYRILAENPILGVTGTNGKTTTCELLGVMLGAPVAGNVGRALCELDGRVAAGEWIVCELSSFQLEDVEALRPRVAVLINLEPDHLDRHETVEVYRAAKLRVFANQEGGDTAVVPRGFGQIPGGARRVEFSGADPLPAEPRIPGAHNRENAAAATAAARAVGIDDAAIAEALETFPGVAHRLELVAEVGGVRYVNDSKATNVPAARRALAAFDAPLHVIMGGSLKGESFDELARVIPEDAAVYLIGEAAPAIAEALDGRAPPIYRTLGEAFAAASGNARPGDVVLLSPACASYDQFRDFEHRGEEFRRLVQNLGG